MSSNRRTFFSLVLAANLWISLPALAGPGAEDFGIPETCAGKPGCVNSKESIRKGALAFGRRGGNDDAEIRLRWDIVVVQNDRAPYNATRRIQFVETLQAGLPGERILEVQVTGDFRSSDGAIGRQSVQRVNILSKGDPALREQRRLDAERKAKAEADRIAAEKKAEADRRAKAEADRRAKAEADRVAAEEAESARKAAEEAARKQALIDAKNAKKQAKTDAKNARAQAKADARAEAERQAALARQEADRKATEEVARKKAEADRKAEEDRIAAEKKAEAERIAAEQKAEADRVAAEKKAADKLAREKAAADKKAAEEKLAAEKKAAEEKLAADKKAAQEKVEAEKKLAQQKAAEKAAKEQKKQEAQKVVHDLEEQLEDKLIFGLPTDKVSAFLIDGSGSIQDEFPGLGMTYLQYSIQQMQALLTILAEDQYFTVGFFTSSRPYLFNDGVPVLATPENVRAASEYMQNTSVPSGGEDCYKAVGQVIAGAKKTPHARLDSVYIFSDMVFDESDYSQSLTMIRDAGSKVFLRRLGNKRHAKKYGNAREASQMADGITEKGKILKGDAASRVNPAEISAIRRQLEKARKALAEAETDESGR